MAGTGYGHVEKTRGRHLNYPDYSMRDDSVSRSSAHPVRSGAGYLPAEIGKRVFPQWIMNARR